MNECAPIGAVSATGKLLEVWESPQNNPHSDALDEEAVASERVSGTLAQVRKAISDHSRAKKSSALFDAAAKAKAKTTVIKALLKSETGIGQEMVTKVLLPEAPRGTFVVPAWVRSFHESHTDIRTAGGAYFCTRCGTIATTSRRGRLQQECSGVCKSPDRLNYLLQGRACGVAEWECWPNGEAKRLTMPVYRLPERLLAAAQHTPASVVSDTATGPENPRSQGPSRPSSSNRCFGLNSNSGKRSSSHRKLECHRAVQQAFSQALHEPAVRSKSSSSPADTSAAPGSSSFADTVAAATSSRVCARAVSSGSKTMMACAMDQQDVPASGAFSLAASCSRQLSEKEELASALLDLGELEKAGLRVMQPSSCSHTDVPSHGASRSVASVRVPHHPAQQTRSAPADPDEEAAAAELLAMQRSGFSVRWA